MLDAAGRVVEVSDQWLDYFDRTRTEVEGCHISTFLDDPDGVDWSNQGRLFGLHCRSRTRTGRDDCIVLMQRTKRPEDGAARLVCVVSIHRLGATADSITPDEWLRGPVDDSGVSFAPEQATHIQRLANMGLLAGGIAHDFRNILTTVIGNSDLAINEVPEDSRAQRTIAEVVEAARVAEGLCTQLLDYSTSKQNRVEAVDLKAQIEKVRRIVSSSMPSNIAVESSSEGVAPVVQANASQIQQLLMNLLINAAEAHAGRNGKIYLATGRCSHLEAGCLDYPSGQGGLPPGDYAYVEVRDLGRGMGKAVRGRLFQPFYSTKGAGRGLGMATVCRIVDVNRGALSVRSSPGQGTTIRAFLPAMPAAILEPPVPVARASPITGPGHKFLVADDEPTNRRVLVRMLARLGYLEVAQAEHGVAAYEVFRAAPSDYKLVFLDVTMPGQDGVSTLRMMRMIRPDLHVVLVSGYGGRYGPLSDLSDDGNISFLSKPFSVADLTAILGQRRVLI